MLPTLSNTVHVLYFKTFVFSESDFAELLSISDLLIDTADCLSVRVFSIATFWLTFA